MPRKQIFGFGRPFIQKHVSQFRMQSNLKHVFCQEYLFVSQTDKRLATLNPVSLKSEEVLHVQKRF